MKVAERILEKSCDCWKGYERVPNTKPCEKGSCRKIESHLDEKEYEVSYVLKNPPKYAQPYPEVWKQAFSEYLRRQGHDVAKIKKVDNIEWNEVVRIFNTLLGVKNRKRPDDFKKSKNKDLKVS